jgi:hypothetical protein
VEANGVRLALRHGSLLPLYAGREIPVHVAQVITRAERLLIGYVAERDGTGLALRCELEDGDDVPEAVTLAVGGLAACQACMERDR